MSGLQGFSGSIPSNYEKLLGPYLFEPYALDLKVRLQNENCKMVLELACGTGRVTNHLVQVLSAEGKLIATDLNNDMIAVAKTKVSDKRIEWQVVDAQELPYTDGKFDHVVCQFGVMFFPDKLKAFKESYRVLNNTGKFIFSTWASLNHNRRAALMKEVMEEMFKDEAPDFFSKGPCSFYDTDMIKSLLTAAGFNDVSIQPVHKVAEYTSREDFLNGFIYGSPLKAFIDKKDPSLAEDIKQKLNEALQQEFGDDPRSEMLAYVCIAGKQ